MGFLHIGLLWIFLPLAAIPIALHLLTLHRLRTVELSTFRFLFDSYIQQRRRMKFLEALVALLRTLFLLFLVFSIARPVVRHWDGLFGRGGSGRDVVLLIDSSASMAARTDGETSMQRARRSALQVVDRLGHDDRVTIVRVGAKPEEVCSRFSSDAEAIRSEIETLDTTPSQGNLFAAFSQLFGGEARPMTDPLVYLFSDLQASGWAEFQDGPSEQLVPADTEVVVVDVGSNQPLPNRGVVGGAPQQRRAVVGLPITLRPQVANLSEAETQVVAVSFFVDDKEIARKNITLQPGETGEAELVYTPDQPGVFRGRYEITEDRFPDDDVYRFTIAVEQRVQVLLINGNPAPEPLDNEGLYLRTALISTETEAGPDDEQATADSDPTQAQRELVRALDVIDIPEANLNAESLGGADVVILANCGTLDPAQCNLLCDFVAAGGGLIVLPGDKVNVDNYNQQLLSAPTLPDDVLVSARLGPIEGDPEVDGSFAQFGAVDFAHPVFSIFADDEQRYMTKISIYRRFKLELPDEPGNSWPLAEFSDGQPALIESRFGNGRVLLGAFPFNTRWGNLPLRPEFVPLVIRMTSHVQRAADLQGPSVVAADRPAEFVVAQAWAPASAKVTDSQGRVTPIALQRSNSRLLGAFERTSNQGYYSVEVTGGRAEQPKQGTMAFAVNLAAAESDFTDLTEPQLSGLMPSAKLTVVDASAEAQQHFGSIGNEREIWRPLIALLFVIISVEFLLSTVGGQVVDEAETPSTSERIRGLAQGRWVGQMTGAGIEEMSDSTSDA